HQSKSLPKVTVIASGCGRVALLSATLAEKRASTVVAPGPHPGDLAHGTQRNDPGAGALLFKAEEKARKNAEAKEKRQKVKTAKKLEDALAFIASQAIPLPTPSQVGANVLPQVPEPSQVSANVLPQVPETPTEVVPVPDQPVVKKALQKKAVAVPRAPLKSKNAPVASPAAASKPVPKAKKDAVASPAVASKSVAKAKKVAVAAAAPTRISKRVQNSENEAPLPAKRQRKPTARAQATY
ncbi:hypothetical protein P7C70_g9529, partial [Phenoliferia sp. Uapishka_3]